MQPLSSPSNRTLAVMAAVAFLVSASAAVQTGAVLFTGEELCLGEGCSLVGRLTRISPAAFNLMGALLFGGVGAVCLLARRTRRPAALNLLALLLVGAMASEGVLLAYQHHVATTFCLYCLGILTAVFLLAFLAGWRTGLAGLAGFTAASLVFSLLSFVPFNRSLKDGTVAVRGSSEGAGMYLVVSRDCSHCRAVVAELPRFERCAIRLNPVDELEAIPAGFEPSARWDPRVNRAALRLLGVDQVPALIAEEATGLRLVRGESSILDYLDAFCGPEDEGAAGDLLLGPGSPSLIGPDDEGCGLEVDCE